MREYVRFFLPLGIYQALMGLSVLPLTIAMSRGEGAATALAAYGVGNSVMALGTILIHNISHLALVFGPDPANRRILQGAAALLGTITVAVLLAIGYVPLLTHSVFSELLGVSERLLPDTLRAFRVVLWFAVPMVIRDLYQANLLIMGRTRSVAVFMLVRAGVVAIWSIACLRWGITSGVLIGSIGVVLGISAEASLTFLVARRQMGMAAQRLGRVELQVPPLTAPAVGLFLGPLMVAGLLGSAVHPIIYTGLARIQGAEVHLAAFILSYSASVVLWAPAIALQQFFLVVGRDRDQWRSAFGFAGWVGLTLMILMVLLVFTPMGEQLVRTVYDPPAAVWAEGRKALRVFLGLVPVTVVLYIATALRMLGGKSGSVFIYSKGAGLLTMAIVTYVFSGLGAVAGAWALVLGIGMEAGVMGISAVKNLRR